MACLKKALEEAHLCRLEGSNLLMSMACLKKALEEARRDAGWRAAICWRQWPACRIGIAGGQSPHTAGMDSGASSLPAQSSFQTPCLVGIWSRNLSRTCVELLFEIQGEIDPNDL